MTWPETLPQELLMDGYGGKAPDLLLRSAMEVGPSKVRRRATAGVRPVSGEMYLTAEQLEIFKEFYNDDLLAGSLRFDWTDPDDGTTAVEMRFTEAPSWSMEEGYYRITLALEILP